MEAAPSRLGERFQSSDHIMRPCRRSMMTLPDVCSSHLCQSKFVAPASIKNSAVGLGAMGRAVWVRQGSPT
jgi:hypothetical protein